MKSVVDRSQTLKNIRAQDLDILVIGGGIVGAGVARDAAMRGLKIGVVEQNDFSSGTSSRSSRLLHGGLRYLAQGRIGLVREASLEKSVIQTIAPHLAEPLPFLFPTFKSEKDWVLWQLKIGVKIYDLLCSGRNFGASTWLSPDEMLARTPGLTRNGLNGAVRYFDGFTNDARLTLDSLRSAQDHGAHILNYCQYLSGNRTSLWECDLLDKVTGEKFRVRARAVVNATGPWADKIPHSEVRLRTTKGVHLVVDRARFSVPETVVLTEGKRILFCIPWGKRVILGTTDTDYSGRPEDVEVDSSDVAYVLGVINRFFPKQPLEPADVLSGWAGLRPLIADPSGKPSDISRSHQIRRPEPGWWDVAGGKLTTYRLMAEQTVDKILKEFGGSNGHVRECRTHLEEILPDKADREFTGLVPPPFSRRAVEQFVGREWARSLEDVFVRRSSWFYYSPPTPEQVATAAEWMAELLGWSPAVKAAEIEKFKTLEARAARWCGGRRELVAH